MRWIAGDLFGLLCLGIGIPVYAFLRLVGVKSERLGLMEIGGGGAVIVIATFIYGGLACRFLGIWPWPWSWLMRP
jgi:hypothetical protein